MRSSDPLGECPSICPWGTLRRTPTRTPTPPPCTDADADGHCSIATGGDDCNDANSKVYPGANDTKGKQGHDRIDNDCDGIIDG